MVNIIVKNDVSLILEAEKMKWKARLFLSPACRFPELVVIL